MVPRFLNTLFGSDFVLGLFSSGSLRHDLLRVGEKARERERERERESREVQEIIALSQIARKEILELHRIEMNCC